MGSAHDTWASNSLQQTKSEIKRYIAAIVTDMFSRNGKQQRGKKKPANSSMSAKGRRYFLKLSEASGKVSAATETCQTSQQTYQK